MAPDGMLEDDPGAGIGRPDQAALAILQRALYLLYQPSVRFGLDWEERCQLAAITCLGSAGLLPAGWLWRWLSPAR